MAIVPMSKLTIAAMKSQKDDILTDLQKAGIVQLTEAEAAEGLSPVSAGMKLNRTEEKLTKIQEVIHILSYYSEKKKALFSPARTVSREHWSDLEDKEKHLFDRAEQILRLQEEKNWKREEYGRLSEKKEQLLSFERYKLPLDLRNTDYTVILTGSVPQTVSENALREEMASLAAELFVLEKDEENLYLAVICYTKDAQELREILDEKGFRPRLDSGQEGTVQKNCRLIEEERKALLIEEKKLTKLLKKEADALADFQLLFDFYMSLREKQLAQEKLAETESVFFLQGWIPAKQGAGLKEMLNERFPLACVTVSQPENEEETPVFLENSFFVRPFELVTELYSMPASFEIDPNPVMSIFYVVFFGMMLSDAGYGIILSLLTGIFLLRFKPRGTMEKLIKLIFFGGISTVFWGVLFGGWFGDLLSGLPAFRPRWFNPLEDPMTLLLWSFVFGGIHIVTGMAVKAWLLIRQGKWLSALFDIGLWYVLFAGLLLWFFGAGPWVTILGALGLILTQGRREKNPFKKVSKGLLSLYDITGFVSDILSYSRLLALGLATGVIGQVVNTMASLGGDGIFGRILFILVLVVGHGFNIAINTLGAYVHASRLQYVEFYGKFYTGGGKPFIPFRLNTKYFTVH